MQIFTFLITVFGASYFLLFKPNSQVTIALATIIPFGWTLLFLLRVYYHRKEQNKEKRASKFEKKDKKIFHDPDEFIKSQREKD